MTQYTSNGVAPLSHELARLEQLRSQWQGKKVQYRSKLGNWSVNTVVEIFIDEILYGINKGKRFFFALLETTWGKTFSVGTNALKPFEPAPVTPPSVPFSVEKKDGKLIFVEHKCVCCKVTHVDPRLGMDLCPKCVDEVIAEIDRKPAKRKRRSKALAS